MTGSTEGSKKGGRGQLKTIVFGCPQFDFVKIRVISRNMSLSQNQLTVRYVHGFGTGSVIKTNN
jgi:hypothetical protein